MLIYQSVASPSLSTIATVARYGDNVIADINAATGVVVRTYVTPMLDQNVSMTVRDGQTNPTYYYNQDERQSVVNMTDSTGAVAASYGYSAYGDKVDALTSHVGEDTKANRYTYTGRELSTVSSDYYFRYRWYGAASGSFMSRDPLGYHSFLVHLQEESTTIDVTLLEQIERMSLYGGHFAAFWRQDPRGLEEKSTTPKPSPAKKKSCFHGNCYRWVLQHPNEKNPSLDPGSIAQKPVPKFDPVIVTDPPYQPPEKGLYGCEKLRDAVAADFKHVKLEPLKGKDNDDPKCQCPEGTRKIAAGLGWVRVMAAKQKNPVGTIKVGVAYHWDYHFWAQMKDGTWSHKPGPDAAPQYRLADPGLAEANRGDYKLFCGYFCLPALPAKKWMFGIQKK